ncbi:MAG TPA: L,D-transpeptidase [Candidatus Cloacimonadota bacterium]|nr:L,D-transpeptidase [Candidatus Cloacimonadota bacterium]
MIRSGSKPLYVVLIILGILIIGMAALMAAQKLGLDIGWLAFMRPAPASRTTVMIADSLTAFPDTLELQKAVEPGQKQEPKAVAAVQDTLKKKPAKPQKKSSFNPQDSLWVAYTRDDSTHIESPGEGYLIRISKGKRQLTLFKDGVPQKVYSVGVGKNQNDKSKKADNATPEGSFQIDSIHNSRDWKYNGKKVYGPWFLRLNTSSGAFSGSSWTGIGIHGTSNEKSIGNFVSKGCIRMYNKDITELKNTVAAAVDSSTVRVLILP